MWAGIRAIDLGLGAALRSFWERLSWQANLVDEATSHEISLELVQTSSGGDGGHVAQDAAVSPLLLQVLMPLAAAFSLSTTRVNFF